MNTLINRFWIKASLLAVLLFGVCLTAQAEGQYYNHYFTILPKVTLYTNGNISSTAVTELETLA